MAAGVPKQRPTGGKQEPRVMWRTSKNEARAGYRRSVEPITPLEKAPRVAVQYRAWVKNVHHPSSLRVQRSNPALRRWIAPGEREKKNPA
jgi:hypothetical protein